MSLRERALVLIRDIMGKLYDSVNMKPPEPIFEMNEIPQEEKLEIQPIEENTEGLRIIAELTEINADEAVKEKTTQIVDKITEIKKILVRSGYEKIATRLLADVFALVSSILNDEISSISSFEGSARQLSVNFTETDQGQIRQEDYSDLLTAVTNDLLVTISNWNIFKPDGSKTPISLFVLDLSNPGFPKNDRVGLTINIEGSRAFSVTIYDFLIGHSIAAFAGAVIKFSTSKSAE